VHTDGVEIVITHHCNLRCRACAYLSPIQSKVLADPNRLGEDLAALARSYHASEARVLGGEPLLHPEITSVLAAIRASGVCDSVRVITNGLHLSRASTAFWDSVEAISVSVYPGREPSPETATALARTALRHGVSLNFKRFDYFRQSYSEIGTSDGRLVRRIYDTCQMAHVWKCHTVWDGQLYRCPQSLFLPMALDALDDTESIKIAADGAFLGRLLTFLRSPDPLPSCRYCLGSIGRLFANEQTPRARWRDGQRMPTEDLVDWSHLRHLETNPGMLVKDTSYLNEADPIAGVVVDP